MSSADYRANVDPVLGAALSYTPRASLAGLLGDALDRGDLALAVKRDRDFRAEPAHLYYNTDPALVAVGVRLIGQKKFAGAVELTGLSAEANPHSPDAHALLGEAHFLGGDKQAAAHHFERARAAPAEPGRRRQAQAAQTEVTRNPRTRSGEIMNVNISRLVPRRLAAACLLASSLAPGACAQQRAAETKSAASPTAMSQPAASQPAAGGVVLRDVPEKIDAGAKYLFYLHGRIVEVQGVRPRHERHGFYEYEEILRALAARGFNVISEPRPADTVHVEYARKVVAQIGRLLAAGVPARNVTVVGASKGGAIAVLVSTLLQNRDVNFVVLAGCGGGGAYRENKVDLYGRVLSIYDTADEFGGAGGAGVSCAKFFRQSTGLRQSSEIAVKLGVGHGLLYKPFKEWVDPAVEWANGR